MTSWYDGRTQLAILIAMPTEETKETIRPGKVKSRTLTVQEICYPYQINTRVDSSFLELDYEFIQSYSDVSLYKRAKTPLPFTEYYWTVSWSHAWAPSEDIRMFHFYPLSKSRLLASIHRVVSSVPCLYMYFLIALSSKTTGSPIDQSKSLCSLLCIML